MISTARINVLVRWHIFLCVANITSQYYRMFFVLVELICILKYKLNKSYLCLTHGQFLSSLIQPLSTSERITGLVECLHQEIRKI